MTLTCEWFDPDGSPDGSAETCSAEATHFGCDGYTCEHHKCGCATRLHAASNRRKCPECGRAAFWDDPGQCSYCFEEAQKLDPLRRLVTGRAFVLTFPGNVLTIRGFVDGETHLEPGAKYQDLDAAIAAAFEELAK